MAHKTIDDDMEEHIVDVDVTQEMESSFLEYAYSVIFSRALPDARDGLKPVQRRILYGMDEMGVRSDKSHVKCARVVGQVMGLYHPHGDSAIYDALVRMSQPWSQRLPLVDGHGNFGSPDAGPAAMRYTECRLTSAAEAMVAGLGEDTVDFRLNYDGKFTEPTVLPSAIPNLLVNGATGIAVGMATNIPPHNLVETVSALKHLLRHPDADLDTLMRFIPGPDLPTGGRIIGLDGIKTAYASGRGSFKVRASAKVERVSPRRRGIVVTELPYGIGPEKIIDQIKNLVQSKKLTGIADVKDLTDLEKGTRLVIEVKNGINPDVLLEDLFRLTKLEDSFSMNVVALVDGQPRTLSLLEMLQVFLGHRIDVIRRRTTFRLTKATDRLHLVEGMLLAIVDIDDVIAIIRSSEDATAARQRLMEAFELTELQANYILDMQLRRLTKFSRIELERERDTLLDTITQLQQILNDEDRLHEVVSEELDDVAARFGTPRRTVLLASAGSVVTASGPLEIADDPCWVLLSATGLVARTDVDTELPTSGARTQHDVLRGAIRTTARGEYGIITNMGRLVKGSVVDLPTMPVTATPAHVQGGTLINDLLDFEPKEHPIAVTTLGAAGPQLALGTRNGVVKRVNPEVLSKDSWELIRLDGDDEVVGAVEVREDDTQLVFITTDAQLLHFSANSVRPQGRTGGGIAGVRLSPSSSVLWFGAVSSPDAVVVTVSGSSEALPGTAVGAAKITPFAEFPAKGRATGGVRCHRFLKGEDALVNAWAGPQPVVAAAESGTPVDLPSETGKRDGSGVVLPQPVASIGTRVL